MKRREGLNDTEEEGEAEGNGKGERVMNGWERGGGGEGEGCWKGWDVEKQENNRGAKKMETKERAEGEKNL